MENKYKYDVFISSSSKDLEYANTIRENLTNSGLTVFYGNESLKKSIGLEYVDEINNALQQSQHFLLICTPHSMASEWVRDEYNAFYYHIYKKSEKKRRFMILEGPGFNMNLLPLMIRQVQTAKSVGEILEILGDRPTQKEESQKGSLKKSGENILEQFLIALREKKLLKWFGIALVSAVLITSLYIVINLKKNPVISQPNKNQSAEEANQREGNTRNNKILYKKTEPPLPKDTQSSVKMPPKKDNNLKKDIEKQTARKSQPPQKAVQKEMVSEEINGGSTILIHTIKNPPIEKNPLPEKPNQNGDITGVNKITIYVTNLSFMDVSIMSPIADTEVSELFNNAILKGMHEAGRLNNSLIINGIDASEIPKNEDYIPGLANKNERIVYNGKIMPGIPNNEENADRLISIIFAPDLKNSEKIDKLKSELLNPHNIDAIVSGFYIDDAKSTSILLRPLIIYKSNKTVMTKNIEFKREEFICEDAKANRKILCPGSFKQISQAVKELVADLRDTDLKISNLSFMDFLTQCSIAELEISKLIDEAVINGINTAIRGNINVVGRGSKNEHLIPNNYKNIQNLVNITLDPGMTNLERINKIITELMIPHNVDVIVTGQYIDDSRNKWISVRPLVIVKASQKIVTRNLQFSKQELFCQNLSTNKKTLCAEAHNLIVQAVMELLKLL